VLSPGSYNSNGYARGLLESVDLPLPSFLNGIEYPGWGEPVPASYFSPR
jgi:hypothetical protein